MGDSTYVFKELVDGAKSGKNIRGALIGRNVHFPGTVTLIGERERIPTSSAELGAHLKKCFQESQEDHRVIGEATPAEVYFGNVLNVL